MYGNKKKRPAVYNYLLMRVIEILKVVGIQEWRNNQESLSLPWV